MAVRKYLARDYRFDVSTDNRVTWIPVSGISSWTLTIDSADQDTSTFDGGSWGSSMFTQRTGSMSLEGFWLVDSSTGTQDPGQRTIETYATRVGYGAYADIRVRAVPSGYAEIGNFYATCQFALADRGGGTTDVDTWGTDILFEGRPVGSGVFSYLQ